MKNTSTKIHGFRTSLALASHANIWQSAYIGSLAAACQVSRLGNIPLALENILDLLQH